VASQAAGPPLVPLFRSLERYVPAGAYRSIIVLHPPADANYFALFLPYIPVPLRLLPVPMPHVSYASAAAAMLQAHTYSSATFVALLDAGAVFARPFTRDELVPAAGGMVARRATHANDDSIVTLRQLYGKVDTANGSVSVDPALVVLPRAWLAANMDALLALHGQRTTGNVSELLARGGISGVRNVTIAVATFLATSATTTWLPTGMRSVLALDGFTPANGAFAECLIRAAQPDTCEGPIPPYRVPPLVAPPDLAAIKARVAAATPLPLPPQIAFTPRSPPVIDFFIRTWYGDGHWLTFTLRSIALHVPRGMYRNIIINYATHEDPYFRSFLPHIADLPLVLVPEDDVYINVNHNGGRYASQIYTKYHAWTYSDADYFIHMDSDTMIAQPVTRADFVGDDGRTYFNARNISKMPYGAGIWARAASVLLGHPVEWELMTMWPFVYGRDVYQDVIAHIESVRGGLPLLDVARGIDNFCEFTTMGAYLVYHMPTRWEHRTAQFTRSSRSWSGLGPGIAACYECSLRVPRGASCKC